MDIKLSKEPFVTQKILMNQEAQQSLELDYVLPDYCPEIFKVLSLKIYPSASKRTVNGSKLSFELTALVRVSYVSEQGEISSVEQTLSYDKSFDLNTSPKNPVVYIDPLVETKSCRVVNKRRIDVRGVITTKIRVYADEQTQAVSGAAGGGLQLKKSLVTYPSRRLFITKRVTVVDEVEIISTKPPIGCVLRADAAVTSSEKKVLSGKLLTKGEVSVSVLYVPEAGGNSVDPEKISFDLPFSQVSDIEGLDEHYDIFVDASVAACDIRPLPKSEPAKLECELKIDISCLALRFESSRLADDVFSTECETQCERTDCLVECVPGMLNEQHRAKTVLTYSEGEIKTVLSAHAECCVTGITKKTSGESAVSGRLSVTVYAKNESGKPICLENDVPFEHELPGSVCDCAGSRITACAGGVAYNLAGSNAIEVSCEVKLRGYVCEVAPRSFITSVTLDETKPVERDRECSLKLYYAEPGESPWEIAKRCRTSLKGVIEENDIDGETVENGGMLLIPID